MSPTAETRVFYIQAHNFGNAEIPTLSLSLAYIPEPDTLREEFLRSTEVVGVWRGVQICPSSGKVFGVGEEFEVADGYTRTLGVGEKQSCGAGRRGWRGNQDKRRAL